METNLACNESSWFRVPGAHIRGVPVASSAGNHSYSFLTFICVHASVMRHGVPRQLPSQALTRPCKGSL